MLGSAEEALVKTELFARPWPAMWVEQLCGISGRLSLWRGLWGRGWGTQGRKGALHAKLPLLCLHSDRGRSPLSTLVHWGPQRSPLHRLCSEQCRKPRSAVNRKAWAERPLWARFRGRGDSPRGPSV